MKKVLAILLLSVSVMFAALDLNTASKNELMSIKGIGSKKADQIIKYRKNNTIKSVDDLKNIKGFGSSTIDNIKKEKIRAKAKERKEK